MTKLLHVDEQERRTRYCMTPRLIGHAVSPADRLSFCIERMKCPTKPLQNTVSLHDMSARIFVTSLHITSGSRITLKANACEYLTKGEVIL